MVNNLRRLAYFLMLAAGLIVWAWQASAGTASPHTSCFWVYIAITLTAELYLVTYRFTWPNIYRFTKCFQAISSLAIIFILANGDLGRTIALELIYIGVHLAPWRQTRQNNQQKTLSPANRGGVNVITSTWQRLNWINNEIMVFTFLALGTAVWQYQADAITLTRVHLIAGLAFRAALSVYRVNSGRKPGCRMDQNAAIALAAWWIFAAVI